MNDETVRPEPAVAEDPLAAASADAGPHEPRETPLRQLSPLVEGDLVEGDYLAARIWTA